MNTIFYEKYFSEPGVKYFVDSDVCIIIWMGFFDGIFNNITSNFCYDDYPVEFKEYNDTSGWRDDDSIKTKINSVDTIIKIESIKKQENRGDYSNCIDAVLNFLKKNSHENIYISTYL